MGPELGPDGEGARSRIGGKEGREVEEDEGKKW